MVWFVPPVGWLLSPNVQEPAGCSWLTIELSVMSTLTGGREGPGGLQTWRWSTRQGCSCPRQCEGTMRLRLNIEGGCADISTPANPSQSGDGCSEASVGFTQATQTSPPPRPSKPTVTWVCTNLSPLPSSSALQRLTTLDFTIALFIDHQRADMLASAWRQDSGLWQADVAVAFWTVSQDYRTPSSPPHFPTPSVSVAWPAGYRGERLLGGHRNIS